MLLPYKKETSAGHGAIRRGNTLPALFQIILYPGEGGGAGYKHVSFQYDQCHAEGRGNGRQGTAAPWPQWAGVISAERGLEARGRAGDRASREA